MAPAGQYVFAEMLGISEHFTAGSHEWLPYSVIPIFPKLICKQQFTGQFLYADIRNTLFSNRREKKVDISEIYDIILPVPVWRHSSAG